MTTLTTDLNTAPYFDDYSEDKQYYRILFRPRIPVQARELTQLQTILQNQIQRLGDHVFKDGSVVDGVAVTYIPNFNFVNLKDGFTGNTTLSLSEIDSAYLLVSGNSSSTTGDSNNGVRAVVLSTKAGFENQYPNVNRLYVKYIKTGKDLSNNDVTTFSSGDKVYLYNQNQSKLDTLIANNLIGNFTTITANLTANTTGNGYGVSVTDGIIYQKGFFLKVNPQTIVVKDFDSNPNGYVIGFNTLESIITEAADSSLNDNAQGYDNFNAPGAHRLKLVPTLVAKTRIDASSNKNFFSIAEFDGSTASQENIDPMYNRLGDIIADRTAEESGDYAVKPFQVETLATANSSTMYYEVSPGIAYVKGYRVELIGSKRIETDRALTTDTVQNQSLSASFGNYVVINEYVGAFDNENLVEVALYDAAFTAVSQAEGISGGTSGSQVGVANVRGIQYNSGIKGTPTATYNLYLFNIRMNSGKTFASDVKAIYQSTSSIGRAKADIVLESNTAVIKDGNLNTTVFASGVNSVRRLTNNTGVVDTTFFFRQTSSATLQTNGFATFTLDTPGPGGTERLVGSVLTNTLENEFNISLSANAYSANITGTVAITNASANVTGSGTSFTALFTPNSFIRISANSTNQVIKRVVSVTNNTLLTVDSVYSVTNATAVAQRYWMDGSIVNLLDANGSINVISNTQFTISTNLSLDSGTQTIYAQYPVQRTLANPAKKEIKRNRIVRIDPSNNAATTVGPYILGVTDVLKIKAVYVGSNNTNHNLSTNRANWFYLDTGQRDEMYGEAKLVINPAYASNITANTKLVVVLDRFTANTSTGVGFFSVDSYPANDAINANTSISIQTAEIPLFLSSSGTTYDLRNSVDFRPIKVSNAVDTTLSSNTSNNAAEIATSSINPVANNNFAITGGNQYLIEPNSVFEADYEFYLPRYDLLAINKKGDLAVRKGLPALVPQPPIDDQDSSVIAQIYVAPYPSLTQREGEVLGRADLTSSTTLKNNRRYTMRDISVLEDRINRLEYYTVLSALEQSAKNVSIPDENNLDRFKNGIFADPFNSHNIGKVSDFEYKIAIDPQKSVARPKFSKTPIDFTYNANASTNVVRSGTLITLPYNNEIFISQRFATKFRNCTGALWQWNGKIDLYPSIDFFQDETRLPNINVDLDLSAPFQAFANSPFGTIYGDFRSVGQVVTTDQTRTPAGTFLQGTADPGFGNFIGTSTGDWRPAIVTTQTTTDIQAQLITQMQVESVQKTYNFGDNVTDISIQPYMRSRQVAFVAYNMKPNTTLHAFFDDVLIDQYCAPGVLSNIPNIQEGREDAVVTRTANFGTPLRSDSNGFVCGIFSIPAGQFRVGDRIFQLTNVTDTIAGADAKVTVSTATYSASNVSVTRRSNTLTTKEPIVKFNETLANTRTVTTTTQSVEFYDPISQSFSPNLPVDISGTYVTQCGIFLKTADPTLGLTVYVMEMQNGVPNTNKIVGKAYRNASYLNTVLSENGQTEAVFVFDNPIFLSAGQDYAFMVEPDGNSPEFNIWIGEAGGTDVFTGESVFANPYSGICFISSNRSTWTPLQKEDIKFNLYRARFTASTGTAVFDNENDEYLTLNNLVSGNNGLGSIQIGDFIYRAVNNSVDTANTANGSPVGTVQSLDLANGKVVIDTTTSGFAANTKIVFYRPTNPSSGVSGITANVFVASANLFSIDNLELNAVVPQFSSIVPLRGQISFAFKGTDVSGTFDTNQTTVTPGLETELFDKPRYIYSRSNELTSLTGAKSARITTTFVSENEFISPALDISKKSIFILENLINNDANNEHTKYGNAIAKYVSRDVILADGQDAEDIKVYLTAYRPVGSNILVYGKFLNATDPEDFDTKVWTLLNYDGTSSSLYSTTNNTEDFKEYSFSLPNTEVVTHAAYLANGIIQYTGSSGALYTTYKTFGIKIVLLSDTGARVPILDSISAICLQK